MVNVSIVNKQKSSFMNDWYIKQGSLKNRYYKTNNTKNIILKSNDNISSYKKVVWIGIGTLRYHMSKLIFSIFPVIRDGEDTYMSAMQRWIRRAKLCFLRKNEGTQQNLKISKTAWPIFFFKKKMKFRNKKMIQDAARCPPPP